MVLEYVRLSQTLGNEPINFGNVSKWCSDFCSVVIHFSAHLGGKELSAQL